jgi:hypothetical protein
VKTNVKTKIRYNGKEYSSPEELPAEVRAAYYKAMADDAVRRKVVINGQEFATQNEMPADVRKLYDDVLSVIENNGEVTLPSEEKPERLLTKRELLVVIVFALGIASLIAARLAE